ncbi:MAG TPA: YbgC/FadM family acyl-CoA thioesterase [Arcobacter sp.]|nr:YbgC/FadM family acyl-CoA thioesterase [Arcobacter sp.]
MKIRVYYEDTDAGGIVYHTNYIKYCERARSEIFFKQEIMPTLGEHEGFVVRNINAHFIATSVLGDMLEVKTKVLNLKNSSTVLVQEVWKDDNKLFSMEIVLVYIREGKPCRIPEELREVFTEDY